ncbi:MAG: hypothetical protein ACE5JN_12530 [Candidatus Methylomirabilia bacterium]
MIVSRVLSISLAALVLAAWVRPLAAEAAEYRLQVASLHEEAFYALLGSAGTRREGPVEGYSPLIETVDTGEVPAGVLLYRRSPEASRAPVATAFGGVRARLEVQEGEAEAAQWSEVRWEGKPGDQSVWVIAPPDTWYTEVRDLALKGSGRLVRVIPHLIAFRQPPTKALGIQLNFIQAHEGKPALWGKHLSTVLDLGDGIAVVVGENSSSIFADHVFIIVKHAPAPTTYKLVLGWGRRVHEIQAR